MKPANDDVNWAIVARLRTDAYEEERVKVAKLKKENLELKREILELRAILRNG